ncbi:MAG: aminotransferase class IV [Candidatus Krumholzibacteriia bacterium]
MIVYLDGRYREGAAARVSIWDGGFLYGDGVYTTLRLYRGRPLDLAAHHGRLVRHAAALDLRLPVDEAGLAAIIARLVARNGFGDRDGRLRVTLTRGADPLRPLPLDRLDEIPPTLLVTLGPLPAELAAWQRDGIGALCLPPGYARGNLPELKTLNGVTTVLAQRRAAAAGCVEALLTAPDGRLLEGAVSNLFLVDGDGTVATPAAAEGEFLAGRTRERILGICARLGIPAREGELRRPDLDRATEVFVASSVREILPVVHLDGRPVGAGAPGPVTRRIQQAYAATIAADAP